MIGIGDKNCNLTVYIENRPPIDEYQILEDLIPAIEGELSRIGRETGNHWRKIIDLYAKLGFSLNSEGHMTWQSYRDCFLLTSASHQALLFDDHIVTEHENCTNIICGKTYAMKLLDADTLIWLDDNFAVNNAKNVIVAPYFDYRQLTNIKLEKLVSIIHSF